MCISSDACYIMNGPQLKSWRQQHQLTLRELAETHLNSDVTHVTVSRWEASPDEIPTWASDKLLAHTQITLPLDELHQVLDLARKLNVPARQLIADAIRCYLASMATVTQPRPCQRQAPASPQLNAAEQSGKYKA